MNKLIAIIIALAVLGSPVYGQARTLAVTTCEGYGNGISLTAIHRDLGTDREEIKALTLKHSPDLKSNRLKYALLNTQYELIDAIYDSSCKREECTAKFYSLGYDGCMDAFKKHAEELGLSW